MFTGIVETQGKILDIIIDENNYSIWVESIISNQLKPNQSLAHNGVCLTIEEVQNNAHKVTLVQETLHKTTFKNIHKQHKINLERAMTLQDRLDGHLLQGHIDTTATLVSINNLSRNKIFTFKLNNIKHAENLIEKGSIAINGVSLTCFDVQADCFSVSIIPHTLSITTLDFLEVGNSVNIEFDMIGKYILQKINTHKLYNLTP